jgi:cytidylate kinase
MTLKSKAFDVKSNFVVALDGPAASGKGTVGRLLSNRLNLFYFQSSIVYRSLAIACIRNGIDITDIEAVSNLSESFKILRDQELQSEFVGNVASKIAAIPRVRENLGTHLRRLISTTPRILMEGRDIGSVIAPEADLKLFIKADVAIRAKRRYKELQDRGEECSYNNILEQLLMRDARDTERAIAPLVIPQGALEIDTSNLTPEETLEKILEMISTN